MKRRARIARGAGERRVATYVDDQTMKWMMKEAKDTGMSVSQFIRTLLVTTKKSKEVRKNV